MREWYEKTLDWLQKINLWDMLGQPIIRILLIIVLARIAIWLLHKTVNRIVNEQTRKKQPNETRRMTTVGRLLNNGVSYVIYFIAGMLVLSEFGVDLGPLLAGAGVVGIAIGFGAQSLVKDILTGFFIILEDQFAVGDVIQTGQFKGTVEVIGLRTTKLQSWTGEVHIIPNGMINEVTNFSLKNTLAVVDVSIAYEADIERAIEVINATMDELTHENLVKRPEVLGVQMLNASSVSIRIVGECMPNTHAIVTRAMNKAVKEALDKHGIEIPYPKMITYQRKYEGA
ncbi:mechanosensitive ion channel family protein [Paenibacillus sp. J5C_2022]|uniref:mechanosensitive ion channel family protein n=1 Tax=Paenibacillus sp. J5C2022 TaxID=2977129 RepID=UPI0021D16FDD|nr:mechanosensitive ion channel family protein [Paenibacillus sp. J5C2022]MCU6710996.1 mechanosensitive ion channel family protein [Paenibacillus sp. J5C2022]